MLETEAELMRILLKMREAQQLNTEYQRLEVLAGSSCLESKISK